MKTLYKGHIGTKPLSTLQRLKCINMIGKSIFGPLESVLCREVPSIVSFIQSVIEVQLYTCLCVLSST